MSKTNYTIEYNPASKTWCLYKNIEGNHSYNFYPIVQSENKKDCQIKLDEINKKNEENKSKLKNINKKRKGIRAVYNLYENDKLIDTDTKDNLLKKYNDLKHNNFYPYYFYKKGTKYKIEKVGKTK